MYICTTSNIIYTLLLLHFLFSKCQRTQRFIMTSTIIESLNNRHIESKERDFFYIGRAVPLNFLCSTTWKYIDGQITPIETRYMYIQDCQQESRAYIGNLCSLNHTLLPPSYYSCTPGIIWRS